MAKPEIGIVFNLIYDNVNRGENLYEHPTISPPPNCPNDQNAKKVDLVLVLPLISTPRSPPPVHNHHVSARYNFLDVGPKEDGILDDVDDRTIHEKMIAVIGCFTFF